MELNIEKTRKKWKNSKAANDLRKEFMLKIHHTQVHREAEQKQYMKKYN